MIYRPTSRAPGTIAFALVLASPIAWAAGLTAAANPRVAEQVRSYEETYGAAAFAPETVRQVVRRLGGHCVGLDASLQPRADEVAAQWEGRHRRYLDESALIRKQYRQLAEQDAVPPEQRKRLRALLDVEVQRLVDRQFTALVAPIGALPGRAEQARRCSDYLGLVAQGQLDLERNDPQLADYFKRRLAQPRPAPAASPPVAPPPQGTQLTRR